MDNKIGNTMRLVAITANVAALHTLLANAASRSAEAHAYMLQGECKAGIGTLVGLDSALTEAQALFLAALALHSSRNM